MKKTFIIVILIIASVLFGYEFRQYSLRVTFMLGDPSYYITGKDTEDGKLICIENFTAILPISMLEELAWDRARYESSKWLSEGEYVEIVKVQVLADTLSVVATIRSKE